MQVVLAAWKTHVMDIVLDPQRSAETERWPVSL